MKPITQIAEAEATATRASVLSSIRARFSGLGDVVLDTPTRCVRIVYTVSED